jgi:hypothetical protein
MKITMTVEQFEAIKRLGTFSQYYIEDHDPTGEQYFSDLEDVCAGIKALTELDQQIQFS